MRGKTALSTPGRGGMGAIYRAHDTKLKGQVAIKIRLQALCCARLAESVPS